APSIMTDDKGIATVEFTTTKQPGDNFKVAGSCSQKYLDGVVLNNDDGSIIQDSIPTPLPTAHGKLTQMLTVWRKVHVEVDAMKPSVENFYRGRLRGPSVCSESILYSPTLPRWSRAGWRMAAW